MTYLVFTTSIYFLIALGIVNFVRSFFSNALLEQIMFKINKLIIPVVIIVFLCLIFGFVTPHIAQESDYAYIDESILNIKLYQKYSEEYSDAARKQIEEYQKMQAEMARTASIKQLQFWSEQTDVVGNELSKKVKQFQELIMTQELSINKAKARISRRLNDKFYFWID